MPDPILTASGLAEPGPLARPAAVPAPARPGFTLGQKALIWFVALVVLVVALYQLKAILLPFLVGAGVAYFLDPAVRRLSLWGLPRGLAATAMILLLFGTLTVAVILLLPMAIAELTALVAEIPEWFRRGKEVLNALLPGDLDDAATMSGQIAADAGEALRDSAPVLALGLYQGMTSLVSAAIFWVVMPVVAFYLLLDWPRVVRAFDEHLPRDHALTIRRLACEIDATIAGFVRGSLLVVAILAVYYAAALSLAGLNYGLVVGVFAGLISFVPFVGAIVAGAVALGLALVQFWGDFWWIGVIGLLFLGGQFLESNVLVPLLVGGSVRLHPVWLIFAVMAFGSLFGLTGALIAVPVAASLGVLTRFALGRYRDSTLYRGQMMRLETGEGP